MRIVLDTNILVRANVKARGPAKELLQLVVGSPKHVLLLSPFLLQELERVFSYERVKVSSKLLVSCRRIPDDDTVVHAAVVGRADALCTLNRDFFSPVVRDYCRERGLLIANDVELLSLLRNLEPS